MAPAAPDKSGEVEKPDEEEEVDADDVVPFALRPHSKTEPEGPLIPLNEEEDGNRDVKADPDASVYKYCARSAPLLPTDAAAPPKSATAEGATTGQFIKYGVGYVGKSGTPTLSAALPSLLLLRSEALLLTFPKTSRVRFWTEVKRGRLAGPPPLPPAEDPPSCVKRGEATKALMSTTTTRHSSA